MQRIRSPLQVALVVAMSTLAMTVAGTASAAEGDVTADATQLVVGVDSDTPLLTVDGMAPGGDEFEITAWSEPATPESAQRQVIRCVGSTDNPHRSNTDPSRANVHVRITCTANVSKITVRGAIYRDGRLAGTSARDHTTTGRSSAANHANTACINNHEYGSWVGGEIVFPPGYTPPTGRISASGRSNRFTNC